MCDSSAHSSLMGELDKELFELRVSVSTPLLIVSPSINFTSYYWVNLFGGGQSGRGRERERGNGECVSECVCPLPHPSTPYLFTGLPARLELFQECVEHGCRYEGTENGAAGTSSDRGPLDSGVGYTDRGHANSKPRRGCRGASEAQPDSDRCYQRRPPEPQLFSGPGNHHQRETHRASYQARCWRTWNQY